ncbi:DEAD/DEAH box helicase family protein [uncultured Litoreibacter sp.]|uniref:DEAD/DEAH box helicase family protein n=1 Tax=uncultured Litoreibacter sp. TaxID=1392394 RepID=UPI0026301FA9|nr:DEAD/DEAH box helicase family protein [uncultured Litoreibacter sp.]
MPLTNVTIPVDLDTSADDVDEVLLNPCLSVSSFYDRGVGFFTSKWLRRVADGLSDFAANGGKMRLVTSPKLTPEDWAALKQGEDAREHPALLAALSTEVDDLRNYALTKPVQLLSWMIADGLLEVRIAVPVKKLDGDYHPKVGCFTDEANNHVVFHGSQNETERGFRNFECLDVYMSWADERDAQRVKSHRSRFERIWAGRDPNVRCYRLPSAIAKNLVQFTSGQSRPYARKPSKATKQNKWRHQDDAMAAFLKSPAGILEMATGTGKTRTALKIANELIERDLIDSIIVTTGGVDLLSQWYSVMVKDGPSWPRYRLDGNHKEAGAYLSNPKGKVLIASRSMVHKVLSRMQPGTRNRTLLVCDEIHGLGSPRLRENLTGLMSPFPFRLGLSATPERDYDDEGNRFIESEIGPVIFSFKIEDAIKRGVLCEFDYSPLRFSLSDEDRAERARLIRAHEAAKRAGNARPEEDLYRALADVKKNSRQKIPVFEEFLTRRAQALDRSLIFVATKAYGEDIQKIVAQHIDEFHPYFSGDHRENLQRFADGELNCLLTCHRLSEGIDIQSVRSVILLSADRAKIETIQRLGRCLRTDESDSSKRALVVDLLCEDENGLEEADEERSVWISSIAETRREE